MKKIVKGRILTNRTVKGKFLKKAHPKINDLLNLPGETISKERAKEWLKEIEDMRNEWDYKWD
ncbi:hypothetical protein [Cohnella sp. GCM10012308]|uniref:hypothetical protein n=1 Tax=Cohnella sp. GCM10012308 TaxID=3317329 RepID=UPI00361A56B3